MPRVAPQVVDIFDVLLFGVAIGYIVLCPFTKVEESFNIQAIHDIIYHTTDISRYDHNEFPGVVPRSFIGAITVAAICKPLQLLSSALPKLAVLYMARSILALIIVVCYAIFRRAIASEYGHDVGVFLFIIQAVQFHIMFYISRTLPNTFALALALLGYSFWLKRNATWFIGTFTFICVVFRSEVIVLFGPLMLESLLSRRTTIPRAIILGAIFGIASLATTILIDSYFWRHWLWPEGEVLYYNTYLNKSKNWGTSPFYWYFLVAIPKTMSGTLLLIPVALYFERTRLTSLLAPVITFVALYSFLPHKELRFIYYVFPILNSVAAIGLARLYRQSAKRPLWFIAGACVVAVSLIGSGGFAYVSYSNYPGGEAFKQLHQLYSCEDHVNVHIDVAAAQTGVSRFGEQCPSWVYSKEENLTDWSQFTHLISEYKTVPGFSLISRIEGFSGIERTNQPPFIRISKNKFVYIHAK